jgi:hypothetical protein
MYRCKMPFQMFHLIEFIVTFWTFIISLTLMIEHVTLENKQNTNTHVNNMHDACQSLLAFDLLLIWKNFYNCTDIDYIEIYLFDWNDCRYDFENP